MTDIVTAIYELTGQHNPEVPLEDDKIKDRVDRLFQVSLNILTIPLGSPNWL